MCAVPAVVARAPGGRSGPDVPAGVSGWVSRWRMTSAAIRPDRLIRASSTMPVVVACCLKAGETWAAVPSTTRVVIAAAVTVMARMGAHWADHRTQLLIECS